MVLIIKAVIVHWLLEEIAINTILRELACRVNDVIANLVSIGDF